MTDAQMLINQGRREGRQEGRQEAWQEALLAVLRSRFPTLPSAVEARVRAIGDAARLQALVQSATTASDMDEVGRALGMAN